VIIAGPAEYGVTTPTEDMLAEVLAQAPPAAESYTGSVVLNAHILVTPKIGGTATTVTSRVAAQPALLV
jgi:hypothetical protein